MRLLTKWIVIAFPYGIMLSCNSTKKISGIYQSRFAVGGFFGTKLVLKPDSTFTYRMRGDLVYDSAAGQYILHGNLVILNYRPLPTDTSIEYLNAKESISIHEAITGNKNLHKPNNYIIGDKKLFLTDRNGFKVKRQWGYSRTRKYFLFGKHEYYKRYFLKRKT